MTAKADHYAVVRRPLFTEKGTAQQERTNTYAFEVANRANKIQVRRAIEALFDVKVVAVRTMNQPGKFKRVGVASGRSRPWKKALVTLREGDAIEMV